MPFDPYAHDDHRSFLDAWFADRRGRPSQAVFAERVGVSASTVSYVKRGKRELNPSWVAGWAKAMELDDDAAHYLAALVDLESPSLARRVAARATMRAMQHFHRSAPIDAGRLVALDPWYHAAILELATCMGFREDAAWIASRLSGVTREEAETALRTLREAELLPSTGAALATSQNVSPGQVAVTLREWYLTALDHSAAALTTVPAGERRFSSVMMAIPSEALPEVARRMEEMERGLLELCAGLNGERDRVYQLSMVLIPVSAPTSEPG
ncbi:MAG: TIGR02147 family protein [Alphaproteobacteria bacterium]|nr:TIGR02147 family protein [Alphaproteobacteria bacterium]